MDDVTVVPVRRKLKVDEYYRMAEAEIFGDDDRIELIDGDLIDMAPIGQSHAAIVNGLNEALVLACVGWAVVSAKHSIRLDESSAPQPDLAVLRRRADFYATGERPGPADVLLLIEVADSSAHFDRTVKLPLYARTGIAEVWIVDLKSGVLDAFRMPVAGQYQETTTHLSGEELALALASDIVVRLNLIFG
jgi:Uma2 family endonuclease